MSSQDPINCPGKWLLPNPENMQKRVIKNIVLVEVPIKVKGSDHIGKKATVTASYENKESEVQIIVVSEPAITGAIRNIRFSAKETKKISGLIEEEGVVEIYYKHPLIKKYMKKKNFKNRQEFLTFITDTITREVVRAIVLSGIKENSSRFSIFDSNRPEREIEEYIIREYYEQGLKMHKMFVKLARNLEIGG